MDIKHIDCPGCGAPISERDGKYVCQYCGREVLVESRKLADVSKTIEQAEIKTQEVIASGSEATQIELRRLQLTQELSMLEMRLANLRSEKRTIDLTPKKTNAHYEQIALIQQEEQSISERINRIQAVLYPPTERASAVRQSEAQVAEEPEGDQRSQGTALVLALFLGFIGAHRFYTGHKKLGTIYLFTFGLFGLGYYYDLFMILINKYRDAWGRPLKSVGKKGLKFVGGFFIFGFILVSFIQADPNASPLILLVSFAIAVFIINILDILNWTVAKLRRSEP